MHPTEVFRQYLQDTFHPDTALLQHGMGWDASGTGLLIGIYTDVRGQQHLYRFPVVLLPLPGEDIDAPACDAWFTQNPLSRILLEPTANGDAAQDDGGGVSQGDGQPG